MNASHGLRSLTRMARSSYYGPRENAEMLRHERDMEELMARDEFLECNDRDEAMKTKDEEQQ